MWVGLCCEQLTATELQITFRVKSDRSQKVEAGTLNRFVWGFCHLIGQGKTLLSEDKKKTSSDAAGVLLVAVVKPGQLITHTVTNK